MILEAIWPSVLEKLAKMLPKTQILTRNSNSLETSPIYTHIPNNRPNTFEGYKIFIAGFAAAT